MFAGHSKAKTRAICQRGECYIEERFFDCVCRPFVAKCATNGRRKPAHFAQNDGNDQARGSVVNGLQVAKHVRRVSAAADCAPTNADRSWWLHPREIPLCASRRFAQKKKRGTLRSE